MHWPMQLPSAAAITWVSTMTRKETIEDGKHRLAGSRFKIMLERDFKCITRACCKHGEGEPLSCNEYIRLLATAWTCRKIRQSHCRIKTHGLLACAASMASDPAALEVRLGCRAAHGADSCPRDTRHALAQAHCALRLTGAAHLRSACALVASSTT